MKRTISTGLILLAFIAIAGASSAAPAAKMADEAYEPIDPKKKNPGDECTANDECQKHHACKKKGDKSFCTAPPRPTLPPGVVT